MRIERRLAAGIVLVVWAGFFVWLRLSGEQVRYLGPNTYWVIVFGAITLTIAGLATVTAVFMRRKGRPLRNSELIGLLIVVLPLLSVLAVPSPELGAYAASRKLGSAVLDFEPATGQLFGDPGFAQLAASNINDKAREQFGVAPGVPVRFAGAITDIEGDQDQVLVLTRFTVRCCAADAIPYQVRVVLPEDVPDSLREKDIWIALEGTVSELDGELVVTPIGIAEITRPENPYLQLG